MNINKLLISSFTDFAPVYPDFYNGSDESFFVFNYEDERASFYAEDNPVAEEATVQLHYFTKGDPQAMKTLIKDRLENLNFIVQDTTTLHEEETNYNHLIISALIYSFDIESEE